MNHRQTVVQTRSENFPLHVRICFRRNRSNLSLSILFALEILFRKIFCSSTETHHIGSPDAIQQRLCSLVETSKVWPRGGRLKWPIIYKSPNWAVPRRVMHSIADSSLNLFLIMESVNGGETNINRKKSIRDALAKLFQECMCEPEHVALMKYKAQEKNFFNF